MRCLPLLLLVACAGTARVVPGSYELVGARASADQTMEPWPGEPVTLTVGGRDASLDGTAFDVTPRRRPEWVDGCWTLQGGTRQEWWELGCDGPVDLGEGIALPCPLALLAVCPDGDELVLRDVPDGNGGTGCGASGPCAQFR